jgi:hypothetical protein
VRLVGTHQQRGFGQPGAARSLVGWLLDERLASDSSPVTSAMPATAMTALATAAVDQRRAPAMLWMRRGVGTVAS